MNLVLHARLALGIRDHNLAKKYSEELKDFGFTVVKVSPRGIGFEGSKSIFEKVFNCEIVIEETLVRFKTEPKFPESLKECVDSIYFPTKPTFLR